MSKTEPKLIGFYLYQDVQALDACGPFEVFATANQILGRQVYDLHLFSETGNPVQCKSGLQLGPCCPVDDLDTFGHFDTFFLPGGEGTFEEYEKPAVIALTKKMSEQAKRLCSVCSGSAFLAKAGILDGRKATSHWIICDWLEETYPRVKVQSDAIFVKDDHIYTSAGVTAGMDLALALIEEDFGLEVALDVARVNVMFMKRPGGQSQFSAHLKAQFQEKEKDRQLANWILEHLGEPLTIERMADKAGMSERSFARYFSKTFGETPARFVENCRLESARRLLEESEKSVDMIADKCGFSSSEIMRRSFQRHLNISPVDYRSRFSSHLHT